MKVIKDVPKTHKVYEDVPEPKTHTIYKIGVKSTTYGKKRALQHGITKTIYGDEIKIRKRRKKGEDEDGETKKTKKEKSKSKRKKKEEPVPIIPSTG